MANNFVILDIQREKISNLNQAVIQSQPRYDNFIEYNISVKI